MRGLIVGPYEDWVSLDERIEALAGEIDRIGEKEANCRRLMSVPGISPLISTALVAAIGTGEAPERGRRPYLGGLRGLEVGRPLASIAV